MFVCLYRSVFLVLGWSLVEEGYELWFRVLELFVRLGRFCVRCLVVLGEVYLGCFCV